MSDEPKKRGRPKKTKLGRPKKEVVEREPIERDPVKAFMKAMAQLIGTVYHVDEGELVEVSLRSGEYDFWEYNNADPKSGHEVVNVKTRSGFVAYETKEQAIAGELKLNNDLIEEKLEQNKQLIKLLRNLKQ